MRSGHIVYKVNNLQLAVEEWESKGFEVEYGRKENPTNALIYFSEGAYIELLQNTGIPKIVKFLSKLFGASKKMERFLLNIDIFYKNFKVYLSCFDDLFRKKGIKTIIFYKEISSLVKKLEDRDFIKFRKYTDFDDLKEQILNFSKEEIFYINTFDEKLVLLTNELKKLLNLPFTEKYEIFRNKDLQRKYLLESFPETTVNFQKIDFNKNEKL